MPEYKSNHIIPACMLKQWESTEGSRPGPGVHQYDMLKKKINFSESRGSGRFSFAAVNYFYVPLVGSTRITAVEQWLSGMEGDLAYGLKQLSFNDQRRLFDDRARADRFRLAIMALRHRDEIAMNTIRKQIETSPSAREDIGVDAERDINLVVLENMINAATDDARAFHNYHLRIMRDPSGTLITGDRPFLADLIGDGTHFVALSPYYFAAIMKVNEPSYYTSSDVPPHFVHTINSCIAQHSNKWIIARDEATLNTFIPFADEPKQPAELIVNKPTGPFPGYQIPT